MNVNNYRVVVQKYSPRFPLRTFANCMQGRVVASAAGLSWLHSWFEGLWKTLVVCATCMLLVCMRFLADYVAPLQMSLYHGTWS